MLYLLKLTPSGSVSLKSTSGSFKIDFTSSILLNKHAYNNGVNYYKKKIKQGKILIK